MIHGLDTSFLVAAEVIEHPRHSDARQALTDLMAAGDGIAIAPQILTEFIHVVTDLRRFKNPLAAMQAQAIAEQWWTANDVHHVFPGESTVRQFLDWLRQFSLGRKRLLDTFLSATYYQAGVSSILTSNTNDFATLAYSTASRGSGQSTGIGLPRRRLPRGRTRATGRPTRCPAARIDDRGFAREQTDHAGTGRGRLKKRMLEWPQLTVALPLYGSSLPLDFRE